MSKKLWKYEFKTVRLTLTNGKIVEGLVKAFVDEYDTETEDMLIIGNYMYAESDIKSIEVLLGVEETKKTKEWKEYWDKLENMSDNK